MTAVYAQRQSRVAQQAAATNASALAAYQHEMERQAVREDLQAEVRRAEADRLRALADRYQEPLIQAAFDLQSRLWNILDDAFLRQRYGEDGTRYALNSTAWLFGQYFGWAEIVRREVQFLPGGDERRRTQAVLDKISQACATDSLPPPFRIFRADQRAMGEVMIVPGNDADGRPRSDCMGYAQFRAELDIENGDVGRWFATVRADVSALIDRPERPERLVKLQHLLIDFVDLVDHDQVRFPTNRSKAKSFVRPIA
jgi:hypothetical protein